ncbi:MAG TPA: sensor histidine kinase [Candidatus Sulfotelmatobacter sp.]|nr:sensor histidine kinase [Candidatus Sulfotelmatobacter sp.]
MTSFYAHATILWSQPGTVLVHDNNDGKDILHGAIAPQDANSSRTLYLNFRVDPLSDAATEAISFYSCGVFFYEKGVEHLGIGNGWEALAYSAIHIDGGKMGLQDFYSANPDLGKDWEYVRKGIPKTIVAKIEFRPGKDAHVTVWLAPDLDPGATENNQSTNLITQFDANATFDEIRLVHRGAGDGWNFSQVAIATAFEDFTRPYFWQRKWVVGLTMGSLLLMVGITARLIERRRSHHQIRRLEREGAVAMERARIARDIHDDLGASLTKIHKLAELMDEHTKTQTGSNQISKTISQTARDTIQTMDEIVWAVNPKNDTLKEMADYLVFFTEDLLRPSGLACTLNVPLNLPDISVTAEVRHNLFMVVKEALNNAVKHSSASEVKFSLNYTADKLEVEIADNGQGFRIETAASTGDGLENMRRRADATGGVLEIKSEPGQGTSVRMQVLLPATRMVEQ